MSNPFTSPTVGGFGQQSNTFKPANAFGTSPAAFGSTSIPTGMTSGFGTGGFNSAPSGFGTSGTNVFGGHQSNTAAFGTPATTISGFGTGQTGSGFGTAQTGSGFGTGQTGSGFGTGQTGSGFGTGQTGSGFGTGQTGSGFGTGQTGIGFGTGQVGIGFGTSKTGGVFATGLTGSGFGTNPAAKGFGTNPTSSGIGSSNTAGGFGTSQTASGFGTSQAGSGFGSSQTASGFGTSQAGSGFGTGQTGSGFGKSQTGSGFGINQAGSGFGISQTGSGFGANVASGGFGSQGGVVFGTAKTQAGPVFGVTTSLGSGSVGSQPQSGLFGTSTSTFGGTGFGPTTQNSIFGNQNKTSTTFGGFGTSTASDTFGSNTFGTVSQGSGVFSQQTSQASAFGGTGLQTSSSPFGVQTSRTSVTGSTVTPSSHSTLGFKAFGTVPSTTVGAPSSKPTTGIFGTQTASSSGAFGIQKTSSNVFGPTVTQSSVSGSLGVNTTSSLFGKTGASSNLGQSSTQFGGETKKPELLVKQGMPLSPPSTTLNTVTSPDVTFGGARKGESDRNPLFTRRKSMSDGTSSVGLFGKPVSSESEDKQKGSSKKLLFGKVVPGSSTGTRRASLSQPGTSYDDQKSKRKPSKENDEEPQSKRSIRRMSSTDEMSSRVAIICNHVPMKYNNVIIMRKHFSKFGEVVKVFPNVRKMMTTVHFKTHEEAKEAKTRGRFLDKGVRPMEIFWKNFGRRSTDEIDVTPSKRKSSEFPEKRTTKSAKFKWAQNELDDELSSMSGTSDINEHQVNIMDRPDELIESQVKGTTSRSGSSHSLFGGPGPSTSRTAVNIPTNVDKGSLTVLRNTICHTSADKLQILNLRDKLIRMGMKKTANLKSKAFVGSCTDMCPEKERYDREEKRRLHVFETLNPGAQNPQVDHSKAVKEYSRSSADQEEPLPHELRPLPTLVMTMNYLLSEIANRGEDGKWGDWFDFLWDRTRGIRKDITQQQLSTPDSAELLEKCVRFHIFCSERLCEEDMHTFDIKINNENMTKCLQTLKEFYHDLENKQNFFCRHEAEMRSYMVLMNLNEGDILRETQQLRPDVRNTNFINFAVQVHSALNSNNFVRFFKLVKNASFLQACIMHRYFTQVRTKALRTLIKAYRPKSHYSLTEMVRILGFENKIEARYFCKFHGLNVSDEIVILDKTAYVDPEDTWPPRRAQKLIESKLVCSVGEVINAEPLPPLSLPTPVNSFDDTLRFNGKLDVNDSDIHVPEVETRQVTQETASTSIIQQEVKPEVKPEVKVESLQYTNDDVKDIAKHLFWEVIGDMAREVSEGLIQGAQIMAAQTQNVADVIVEEVVTEYVRSLSQSYYTEVTLLKQKKDKEVMIQNSAVHFTSVIIKDVVDQEVLNLATAEVREIKAQLKKEQIERCTTDISLDLIDLVVKEMSDEVAGEVYQKDVIERLEELEDICHCIELQRAGRYLQRWKKEYSATIKLKRSMLEFPPSVAMDSNYDQVKKLIPTRQNDVCNTSGFYVNKLAKLKIDTPDRDLTDRWVVDRMLSAHELYRKISHLKAWQPLDIASTAGLSLQRHFTGCKSRTFYWKLVLSLPEAKSCSNHGNQKVAELLNKWLRSKFTKGKDETSTGSSEEDILSLYRTKLPYNHSARVQDLGVCIRLAKDEDLSHSDLLGTNGLIFVLPPGMTEDLSSKYWIAARTRLQSLLQLKPSNPAIPLVLIVPLLASQELDDIINTGLDLSLYLEEELVSSVFLRTVDLQDDGLLDVTQPELTEELSECVQWLAESYPNQPDIKVKFLRDFVDDQLIARFFDCVLHNLKLRKEQGYLHQHPEELVQLYNHVVSHMTRVLTSETLKNQSWPVAEFFSTENPDLGIPPAHWNSEDHIDYVEQLIESLQLPWFLNDDFEKDDWPDICEVLWAYIEKVIDDDTGQAKVDLTSKIRLILKKTEEDFADICYLLEKETRCEPSYENIPWTDVVTACIDYKLSVVNFNDVVLDKTFELMAVYMKKELEDYRPPDSWKYVESQKVIDVTTSMKSSVQIAKIKSKAKKVEQSLVYEPEPETLCTYKVYLDQEPESIQEVHRLSNSFTADLKTERYESEKYEQFLQNALMGNDMNCTDMPDITGLPPWSVFDSSNMTISNEDLPTESVSEPIITDEMDKVKKSLSAPLITDEVSRLKKEIDDNRRASDLFENQLRQWLGSPL